MMRWEARFALLTLLALALATSRLLAAAAPAKTPPRLSSEQATRRAAAFARALDVPVDKAAVARLRGSTWVLKSGLSTVEIRDDAGQLLSLDRWAETPPPGAKAVSAEQAVASAARVLKVAGMPAEVQLREPQPNETVTMTSPEQRRVVITMWHFRCGRRTPQGAWYGSEGTHIFIDNAGRVRWATLDWSPGTPPVDTEVEQAKQKAAAFAKAAGLPWDDSASPTLMHTGDVRHPGPTQWNVRCRGTSVTLRGDTGAALGFHRPSATAPSPGKKPPTENEAVAAAARVLRVLGGRPNAPPKEAKQLEGGWDLRWERHTPDGIPYETDSITVTVDATGRVVSASFDWHSRPPGSATAKLSKRQAVKRALDWARQWRWLGTGHHIVTAGLRVVPRSDFGEYLMQDYDVPTRLAWAVSIAPTEGGNGHIIAVDAADGKILGRKSSGWASPPKQRTLAPRAQLALWVAAGPLVTGIAAVVAYLARRREGKAAEEQEGVT